MISIEHSRTRLRVQFDAVVTAEDVGSHKTDLRNSEYALARLRGRGVERERVLHVAQSLYHDHEPARKLGMCTVWVDRRAGRPGWGATRAPRSNVQPDLVVSNLAELAELHTAQRGRDYA